MTISLDQTFPEHAANGSSIRSNFTQVAQDVLQVVQNRFGHTLPRDNRPLVCYVSTEAVPRTDARRNAGQIRIGLALPRECLQGLDYTNFAYQLAHELGHVMMDAHRSNAVLETLADAVSYQALEDLTVFWRKKYANYPAWRDWAYHFREYRAAREKQYLAHLPHSVQVAARQGEWQKVTLYLKQHRAELERAPYAQEGSGGLALRSLGAQAFLSQPVPWRDFIGIALLTNPAPQQDGRYRQDLPLEISRASQKAQRAVARFL